MDEKELNLYNSMVRRALTTKMAVEWLMSKREAVEGVEPTLSQAKHEQLLRTISFYSGSGQRKEDERYGANAYTRMLTTCPFQRILRDKKMPRGKGTYGSKVGRPRRKRRRVCKMPHGKRTMDSL